MLELKDFFHLARLDQLVEQLAVLEPGLILIAGLDPRPLAASSDSFLPSGRAAFFRVLMYRFVQANPSAQAVVVADSREPSRVPRHLSSRVKLAPGGPSFSYADRIRRAMAQPPGLLVVDRLDAEATAVALEAAQNGVTVLSQVDSVFTGSALARSLLDQGIPRQALDGLSWIVGVQRQATLCPACKRLVPVSPQQRDELQRLYPHLNASVLARHPELDAARVERALAGQEDLFFEAVGCPQCRGTGRLGDAAAFDLLSARGADPLSAPSLLSLEEYLLALAALGYLPIADLLELADNQLRRAFNLLTASEQALRTANAALEGKVTELGTANQVLQQRTEALVSLQEIGQALITSTGLDEMAHRVCLHTRELCGADRAILYFMRSEEVAELLAVTGWDPARVPRQLHPAMLLGDRTSTGPTPFNQWPPGILPRSPDLEGAALRAGLRAPLVAQGQLVGVMLVHTTERNSFSPGQVALLQTMAQQAALAIQRAGLIDDLRKHISRLRDAQAELVQKERLERELELARQVQQSVLPRTFPQLPGYTFAAHNEPARRVGGDFYDVIRLDDEHVGLVIADVSDKGMPAALYMALTRSLLLAEARRERSPRGVLANVHRLLAELGQADMFVTVFYGVLDGPARRLTYTRAGHDRPLLLRGETVRQLEGTGTVLGFLELDDLNLSEEQVELLPGDRLVLYTDGLSDALSPEEQPFGLERLVALLQDRRQDPPEKLCASTFARLMEYQGGAGLYDDMTMVVVEVAIER